MTWKSYAVVSGATALATWLASSTPSVGPTDTGLERSEPAASPTIAGSGIQEEASRLQERVRSDAPYREPDRNPFRFALPERSAAPTSYSVEPIPVEVEPEIVEPPPPVVSLAGIAEDRDGETVERTAVLNSPGGVLLVRPGDTVLGIYRVQRVEGGAVELLVLADGSTLRLSF